MYEHNFRWRKIIIPAFGPSLLSGLSRGAVLPIIALSALDLHASHAVSGLIVALVGLGSLISNIPAALVTARFGERRSLVGAALFSILGMALCLLAHHPATLAAGVFIMGMGSSVFFLARQTFLIDAVPLSMRGRAFSLLGGTDRIGQFIGPFGAAAAIHFMGLAGAYWVAIAAFVGAGLLSLSIPDLPAKPAVATTADPLPSPTMLGLARKHYAVLITLGMGVLLLGAIRSSRPVAIPLWAEHIGLGPSATAIIFGLTSGIDMLVFYPAGKVMDEYGRLWVALPCALLLGLSFMAIPLTASLLPFIVVSAIMGFGNGIGSGIVMTLGADAAPARGRTQFLGLWRLINDVGNSSGPFVLASVTALVSLGAGIGVIGAFGLVAALIFWRGLPHTKASS